MSIFLGKKDPTVMLDFAPQSKGSLGFLDNLTKAYENFEANRTSVSDANLLEEELQPYVEILQKEAESGFQFTDTGMRVGYNPAHNLRLGLFNDELRMGNFQKAADGLESQIKELYNSNPEKYPDLKDFSVLSAYERTKERAVKIENEYNEVVQRSPGLSNWFAQTFGEIGSAATDPAYAAAYLFGGGSGRLLQIALTEAALGAGVEGLIATKVQDWYKETGREFTDEEFWTQVLLGGTIGAASPFAFRGLGIVGGKTVQGVKMTAKQMRKGLQVLKESGSPSTPLGRAAENELDNQVNIEETNPLTTKKVDSTEQVTELNAVVEHKDRLEKSEQAFEVNQAPPIPDNPTITPRPYKSVYEPDENTGDKLRFSPDELLVDAQTFQFKEGGDKEGVVSTLLGVTRWEPTYAGDVMVFEYADGRRFIADGHQRLGLAKRILKQDPKQDIQMWGFLYREVDGYTPEQIRVMAAKKNLAAMPSERGTEVIEAAKIIRADPGAVKDLPPKIAVVRQGQNIARLQGANFQTVINGVIPFNYAAEIGRLIPDDAGLQEAAIKILAKTNPRNIVEAEAIIRQVREAGAEQIEQTTLFGDELISESFYLERARLISRVTASLRKDKQAFQTLVKNASELEDAGNVLARSENERRAIYDQTALELIQTLANRRGPLSDELTAAARLARSSGKYDEAERMVLEAVRRGIANGDFDGIRIGDQGTTFKRTEEVRTEPDRIDQAAEEFTEPGGLGSERQANQLEEDLFGARADETLDPVVQERQEVGKLLDEAAPIEQIEQHPSIIKASDEAIAIQQTDTVDGYLTEQWATSRTFKFDLDEVTGYEEAIPRLYDDAKVLAYRNMGMEVPANPIDFNRQATIIIGAPAAGKSSIADPLAVARRAAIIDGDEAKKVMPEYAGGIGANAVHRESQFMIGQVEMLAKAEGANIVIPTVGSDPAKIRTMIAELKEEGYSVALLDAQVSAEESMTRMLRRFVSTGRLIPISVMRRYGNKPSQTYDILKKEGVADGYARIDNNGPRDGEKAILEDTSGILEGTRLQLRDGRGTGKERFTRAVGEEYGGENIIETDSSLELDMEIPIISKVDETGELTAEVKTIRQIKEEAAQEDQMLNRLEGCVS